MKEGYIRRFGYEHIRKITGLNEDSISALVGDGNPYEYCVWKLA